MSIDAFLTQLNWRYACKKFDPQRTVPDAEFEKLLESARLSASSFGLQPWRFYVVENRELRSKLVEHSWGQPQIVDASHLIVLAHPLSISEEQVDRYLRLCGDVRGQTPESLAPYRQMVVSSSPD